MLRHVDWYIYMCVWLQYVCLRALYRYTIDLVSIDLSIRSPALGLPAVGDIRWPSSDISPFDLQQLEHQWGDVLTPTKTSNSAVDRWCAHWDILIPPELLTSSSGSPQVDHRPENLIKISGPEKSEIGNSMKLSMDWFQHVFNIYRKWKPLEVFDHWGGRGIRDRHHLGSAHIRHIRTSNIET